MAVTAILFLNPKNFIMTSCIINVILYLHEQMWYCHAWQIDCKFLVKSDNYVKNKKKTEKHGKTS